MSVLLYEWERYGIFVIRTRLYEINEIPKMVKLPYKDRDCEISQAGPLIERIPGDFLFLTNETDSREITRAETEEENTPEQNVFTQIS